MSERFIFARELPGQLLLHPCWNSCITTGLLLISSTRRDLRQRDWTCPGCWVYQCWPNDDVLLHFGNTPEETEGCILVGMTNPEPQLHRRIARSVQPAVPEARTARCCWRPHYHSCRLVPRSTIHKMLLDSVYETYMIRAWQENTGSNQSLFRCRRT